MHRTVRHALGKTAPGFRAAAPCLGLAMFASLLVLPQAAPAVAATIPFNEALVASFNPEATGSGGLDFLNTIRSAPVSFASNSYAQSGGWGSVNAEASANLATGQLRMHAQATIGDGSAQPYIQSNAIFGDGFRAARPGGSPFAWTAASHAQFTLNLSGILSSSRPLNSTFNADVFVILSILEKDTLDPARPLINGPTARQYFFWNIGNPDAEIFYTDQNNNSQILTPTAQYATIPSVITADFAPGRDFDWVLLLGASGQVLNPGDSFNFDLRNTLDLSFAGPDGSVITSVSEQFVNFNATLPDFPVPEPTSMVILLGALVGMAGVRRRA